ncbi:MAG: trans-AT polyketide synthase/acyltransferase/oxidoreductase domain-containing protein, partial [Gammaproteobacteria bacterium]
NTSKWPAAAARFAGNRAEKAEKVVNSAFITLQAFSSIIEIPIITGCCALPQGRARVLTGMRSYEVSVSSTLESLKTSATPLITDRDAQYQALMTLARPLWIWLHGKHFSFCGHEGPPHSNNGERYQLGGYLPSLDLNQLGDRSFLEAHNLRYPYMAGAMAHGIAGTELVLAMARAGMLGSYGAAGQSLADVERAIDCLQADPDRPVFAMNLIHSPSEPTYEAAIVELYLARQIRLIEASAYLDLTAAVVRYRLHGIHRNQAGQVIAPNRIIAKASRVEVAQRWFSPAPEKILAQLLASGQISEQVAVLAREIPMAEDLIAEADSAGHTDNRPALTLLPQMFTLRDQHQQRYPEQIQLRVGAAGGIGTPQAAAAAFAMGAAFVVTGSVNQASTEAATSDIVKQMLAEAQQADIAMAPAADMFEMGVKLQVLKRGTLFAMRASRLYELYKSYTSFASIPDVDQQRIEKDYLCSSFQHAWDKTRSFFLEREPRQVQRAEADPKHMMALVFRRYLALTSRWANSGSADRRMDYQVWCGPAMGAFNAWTAGSFMARRENRHAAEIAMNILYHAAVLQRFQYLRHIGIHLPPSSDFLAPKLLRDITALCRVS